jgi:carbon-monoxide dehydrogenase medium subunit
MTKHSDVIDDPLVQQHAPLLAVATSTVADPAVRHRGTFGGALAHADPAGDLAAVALALDAELVAEGPGGRRTIAAKDFFVDYLETTLSPDEILASVRVPKLAGRGACATRSSTASRRPGRSSASPRPCAWRAGRSPRRASASPTWARRPCAPPASRRRSSAPRTRRPWQPPAPRSPTGLTPPSDLGGQADYRAHLARVLTARAVGRAAGMTS